MDKHIIFIDTSVFESENFFSGRRIKQLCELSKKEVIEVKITDIVYSEIIQRIDSNLSKAKTAYKKANSLLNGEGKILKNNKDFDNYYPLPDINIENLYSEFKVQLDSFIKDSLIEIIDSEISSIKEVFSDYFKKKPPFNDGRKKYEFPDAFTLNTLKEWAKLNSKKIYFISNDRDFDKVTLESVNCSYNLSSILDLLLSEINEKHTDLIGRIFDNSVDEIYNSLENKFDDKLMNSVFNKILYDPFYEDPDVDLPTEIQAQIDIISINNIDLNNSFSYEIESDITFIIDVEYTDLSSGFYDKEDGVWFGEERISETKNYSANVISIAEFQYDFDTKSGDFLQMTDFEIRSLEEI